MSRRNPSPAVTEVAMRLFASVAVAVAGAIIGAVAVVAWSIWEVVDAMDVD